jgi:Flp pilus assembly pilin Flp
MSRVEQSGRDPFCVKNSREGNIVIADAINGALVRLYTAVKDAKREDGQTFVEYSLIGVLIAVLLVTALTGLKDELVTALGNIVKALGA